MIYYHGSSAEPFERFDLGHAGEGDGKGKFGFGVYVTSSYKRAAHYAYNKHRKENNHFYVYTVEVPDKTEDNSLPLFKGVPVSESIRRRAEEKLGEQIPAEALTEGIPFRKWLTNKLTGHISSIKQMTTKSSSEDEWAASEFLRDIGIDFIEWPIVWKNNTGRDLAVLDDKKVRIIRIEKVELDSKEHHLIEGSQQIIKEF